MTLTHLKKLDCVASIVLYANPPEMVKAVVRNLLECRLHKKIYLIDNSPESSLYHALCNLDINYHSNSENVGFGRGHNIAINTSEKSEYYLIVNPDILIPEGVFRGTDQFYE